MEKEQKTDLKKLVDKYPGSPWAVLAQRDMLTSLGLEWQSAAKRE
jgi:outer membrane protein assembly factor BamD (BamD/ComL family)